MTQKLLFEVFLSFCCFRIYRGFDICRSHLSFRSSFSPNFSCWRSIFQVDMINPLKEKESFTVELCVSAKKESFTVELCVSAEGKKHPAVRAAKTGGLQRNWWTSLWPLNIVIVSSKSAWWKGFLNHEWIHMTFPLDKDPFDFRSIFDSWSIRCLTRDQLFVYKMESSRVLLDERNGRQIFVPVAVAGSISRWM